MKLLSRSGISGVFLAVFLFGQAGCAVGNYGTLVSRTTYTETAKVVDVYALGAYLRPAEMDRGFTLGYRKATYIYPNKEKLQPKSELRWFRADVPENKSRTQLNSTAGVEIQMTSNVRRIAAGLLREFWIVGSRSDESRVFKLLYKSDRPEETRYCEQSDFKNLDTDFQKCG